MLTAYDMAYLRALQVRAMNEQAMITNISEVSDGSGGITIGEVTEGPFPCYRFAEVAGVAESLIGGQPASMLRWKIGLPVGTPIKASSQVTIAGDEFNIISVPLPESYDAVWEVYASKRGG